MFPVKSKALVCIEKGKLWIKRQVILQTGKLTITTMEVKWHLESYTCPSGDKQYGQANHTHELIT